MFDEQDASFDNLTPDVPTDEAPVVDGVGRYRSPYVLRDGQLLVSWADGDVNERNELAGTAPNFGLYLYDPKSDERELVYDDPKLWDLYAHAVAPRDEPPVLRSRSTTACTGHGVRHGRRARLDRRRARPRSRRP